MNIRLKDHLEKNLKIKYAKGEEEWVDIYITPLNRVDTTIVCENADLLDSIEVGNVIAEGINGLVKDSHKYSIGFLEFYTIEEAEDLDIHKPDDKREPITWTDVVSLNRELQSKETDRMYKVICFYSYKGGVGRTTALVQVAYILAKQGKNVVLIDLDLEAPSFHLIFKEWVNNPIHGVKYGLVDYLYERMVNIDPKDHKIKISDIFVPIHFDKILEGNIYVFPATRKLSYEYIFKLTQLQSNIIFENRYMEEVIDGLEKSLNFDTVFIDTRTGINQWGAFSLLGLADQTMLIASPNEENIEGLSSIIELMGKAGLDNYLVAMSKIETDAEGINRAKRYFDMLKSNNQEFIGIGYNPAIAAIEKYPFSDALEPYRVLSDYIIENQIVNLNREFIATIGKTDIRELFSEITGEDCENITTDAENKVLKNKNINLVAGEKEDIERLKKLLKKHTKGEKKEFLRDKDGANLIAYKKTTLIFECKYQKELKQYLKNYGIQEQECKTEEKIWCAYLLYLIKRETGELGTGPSYHSEEGETGAGTEHSLEEYIKFMHKADKKDIINALEGAITSDITLFEPEKNSTRKARGFKEVVICIFNVDKYDKNIIRGLVDCIMFCKRYVPSIRILFANNSDFMATYQDELSGLKGSRADLEWKEEDVKKLVVNCVNGVINGELHRAYASFILKNKRTFGFPANKQECVGGKSHSLSYHEKYEGEIKDLTGNEIFMERVLDLFWGVRTNVRKYSRPVTSWFFKELSKLGNISNRKIADIINEAVRAEIRNLKKAANNENCVYKVKENGELKEEENYKKNNRGKMLKDKRDRIIGFTCLEEALKKMRQK